MPRIRRYVYVLVIQLPQQRLLISRIDRPCSRKIRRYPSSFLPRTARRIVIHREFLLLGPHRQQPLRPLKATLKKPPESKFGYPFKHDLAETDQYTEQIHFPTLMRAWTFARAGILLQTSKLSTVPISTLPPEYSVFVQVCSASLYTAASIAIKLVLFLFSKSPA